MFRSSNSDLRKALVRSKLAEASSAAAAAAASCQQQQQQNAAAGGPQAAGGGATPADPHRHFLPRSDSMDSMLGDSLLDPPQCLQRIPPKRYQSPSRCGSPSMEAPEHLLFGSNKRELYGN